jgi:hypothetical protein
MTSIGLGVAQNKVLESIINLVNLKIHYHVSNSGTYFVFR